MRPARSEFIFHKAGWVVKANRGRLELKSNQHNLFLSIFMLYKSWCDYFCRWHLHWNIKYLLSSLFQDTFMLPCICLVISSISPSLIIFLMYLIYCIFTYGEVSVVSGASLSTKTQLEDPTTSYVHQADKKTLVKRKHGTLQGVSLHLKPAWGFSFICIKRRQLARADRQCAGVTLLSQLPMHLCTSLPI